MYKIYHHPIYHQPEIKQLQLLSGIWPQSLFNDQGKGFEVAWLRKNSPNLDGFKFHVNINHGTFLL